MDGRRIADEVGIALKIKVKQVMIFYYLFQVVRAILWL
jgi:hypothetical protein